MKKSVSIILILILVILTAFSGCNKTPAENKKETASGTGDVSDLNSNFTVSTIPADKMWQKVEDGTEPIHFVIINHTEEDFNAVEYRAYGFENYIIETVPLISGGSYPVFFTKATTEKYKFFEFRFRKENGTYVELNQLDVRKDEGMEVISLNGGYTYKYFKEMKTEE